MLLKYLSNAEKRLKQWFSREGVSSPGDEAESGEALICYDWQRGGDAAGIWWAEARHAASHRTVTRTVPREREDYLAHNVSGAQGEEL